MYIQNRTQRVVLLLLIVELINIKNNRPLSVVKPDAALTRYRFASELKEISLTASRCYANAIHAALRRDREMILKRPL